VNNNKMQFKTRMTEEVYSVVLIVVSSSFLIVLRNHLMTRGQKINP
jgi:hypothetical protein